MQGSAINVEILVVCLCLIIPVVGVCLIVCESMH